MFTYENGVYKLNYTFNADPSYFSFTTELAENNDDGGWAYIEPFRFGAISDGDYWYTGEEDFISLTWDEYHAIRIPAGEYNMTIDLNEMKLYIEKVGAEVLLGDVDNDGEVAIADVAALIDYLLGNDVDPFNALNADFDQDGEIAIADVAALIDYLLNN